MPKVKSDRQVQARNWCFTDFDTSGMIDWSRYPKVRYAIYQMELGEEEPQPDKEPSYHFQGYVEFKAPVKFGHVCSILPTAHWEKRGGTQDQCIAYCRKEETRVDGPYEYGTRARESQGARNDIIDFTESIKQGKDNKYLIDNHPVEWNRYQRGLAATRVEYPLPPRDGVKSQVDFIYNWKTGVGKSYYARKRYPGAYWKPPYTKWWDGYNRHKTVIFDEFDGQWFKFRYLLRVLDENNMQVESKGSSNELVAEKIVITSNLLPNQWYPKVPKSTMPKLYRRIERWGFKPAKEEDVIWFEGDDAMAHFSEWLDKTFGLKTHLSMEEALPEIDCGTAEKTSDGYEKYPKLYSEDDYQ